ncbi:TetR/AcrR family transcriptional regulator [Marinomonas aquiplantarum]|uniref:TetR family transcriptional regulator n=1 Tax=Marinomonas aquiplantarum TaxID=491951 RepID=A0A366D194_9GAMM|nr:TetR/AcrR family transcriptional regulator [Marinomonas aquiplantarum]RBO83842.1 TetR family transcriptional regulator [Marinomonas aquiplantarum]
MARGRPSKKAHIVSAACELFTIQGYQGTSIDQVVNAAAVSKPTVYSNFPTKLVLWEQVLESLSEAAEQSLSASFETYQQSVSQEPLAAWLTLWQTWVSKPEWLAVYRIFIGEQHKMSASSMALFAQFEGRLENILQRWKDLYQVSDDTYRLLDAVTRRSLLLPALLKQPAISQADLLSELEPIIGRH